MVPYHPQTDGMSERTNQTVAIALRHHVHTSCDPTSFDRDCFFWIAWSSTRLPLIAELPSLIDIRAKLSCHQLMGHGLKQNSQSSCVVRSTIRDTADWGPVGPDMDIGFGIFQRIVCYGLYHSRTRSSKNRWNRNATSHCVCQGACTGTMNSSSRGTLRFVS